MDFILEFLGELYLELSTIIIPKDKFKPKHLKIIKLLSTLFSATTLLLLIIGISTYIEDGTFTPTSITLTSIGVFLLLIQIILTTFALIKLHKKTNKANQQSNKTTNLEATDNTKEL